jgi:hypothetical protein
MGEAGASEPFTCAVSHWILHFEAPESERAGRESALAYCHSIDAATAQLARLDGD